MKGSSLGERKGEEEERNEKGLGDSKERERGKEWKKIRLEEEDGEWRGLGGRNERGRGEERKKIWLEEEERNGED
jgi:hypothetical protein